LLYGTLQYLLLSFLYNFNVKVTVVVYFS